MSRGTFSRRTNLLGCAPDPKSPNHRAVLAIKKVAVTLHYLKDAGSHSVTANTFARHISTVTKIIKDVSCAIACNGSKYVQLLQTKGAMIGKASDFEAKYGMHQAFGCIDSTHVTIIRTVEHSQDYFLLQNSFLVSMFKQFVTFAFSLRMLTPTGLGVLIMQMVLQIHPVSKN